MNLKATPHCQCLPDNHCRLAGKRNHSYFPPTFVNGLADIDPLSGTQNGMKVKEDQKYSEGC